MAVVKRQDDAQGEDHSQERHPSVDWKNVAPRWLLVTVIAVLLFAVGWLVGTNRSLNDDRLGRIENAQLDWRKDLLLSHGQQLVDLRGDVRVLKESVGELKAMADDVKRIRILAEAEASRKKKNAGGYGL